VYLLSYNRTIAQRSSPARFPVGRTKDVREAITLLAHGSHLVVP
jgi:hypothetical protein